MRYLPLLLAFLALIPMACSQPAGPETVNVQASAPSNSLDDIQPLETIEPYDAPRPSLARAEPTPYNVGTFGTIEPVNDEPTTHVITRGDTLWALSDRYLGSGRRWSEIAAANPGLEASSLHVGQTIVIPER